MRTVAEFAHRTVVDVIRDDGFDALLELRVPPDILADLPELPAVTRGLVISGRRARAIIRATILLASNAYEEPSLRSVGWSGNRSTSTDA